MLIINYKKFNKLVVKRFHLCYTINENVLEGNENVIDWRKVFLCSCIIEPLNIAKNHMML